MADPVKCRACGRVFNAAFSACPFCNAKVTATAPVAASGKGKTQLDYTAMAEHAVKTEQLILLEFHPAAVAAVDVFLSHTYGESGLDGGRADWKPTAGQEAVIMRFGCFFGEVVRRYFGGYWEEEPGEPVHARMSSVVIPQGAQVFPVNRAFNRVAKGEAENFEILFEQLRAHTGRLPDPSEADGWLRQARFFEARDRKDIAARFLLQALALRADAATKAEVEQSLAAAAEVPGAAPAEAPFPEELQAAISAGEWLLKERGFRTDTGAMTLTAVDVLINSLFGRKPVDAADLQKHPEAPLRLAAFVGDIFVRRFRGRWTAPPPGSPLTAWRLTWPSGISVDPFAIIQRRLQKGDEVFVVGLVGETLRPLVKNGEAEDPPEIAEEWAWQAERLAEDPKQTLWALQFGRMALGYKFPGAHFRTRVAGWAKALGSYKEAAALLAEAAELEPQNFSIALEQSSVASAQKNLAAAEAFAHRATQLSPGHPSAWFALAAAQTALEHYGPAIESYKRALELAPERAPALAGMLESLEALKADADDPL